ncbi:MAG: sigma-54 dependent transcriptional regulator, partial [Pseudomonadota bacterium]
ELMESEFFGHKKGSFTGAHQDKEGLFQSAAGGTLFLDEVADLPLEMQVKLLRTIQEKSIRPIGAQQEIPVDVRILSATHKDLSNAIQEGVFRNDLYYRINVIEIKVAPLRERLEDIPGLAQALLTKIAAKNAVQTAEIDQSAIDLLLTYSFPGNVRELENILERACALSSGERIASHDLQLQAFPQDGAADRFTTPINDSSTADTHNDTIAYKPEKMSIDEYLAGVEKDIILKHLEQQRWNRTTTAKVLGITFRSLRYRLKKLGIDDDV